MLGVFIACTSILTAITTVKAENFTSEYSISVIGLNVGKSSFTSKIADKSYEIKGTLKASGVATLFTSTKGTLTTQGRITESGLKARNFDVQYTEGKKSKRTTIIFAKNRVAKAKNTPPVRKKGKWRNVQRAHLSGVLDPIGAIMVQASSLRDVCSKTIKVFDGAMRANFPMRYVRTIPFSTRGYKGDAVTCRASFQPISGYDQSKKDLNWMRDKGVIDISFAPIAQTGLYAPVKATVTTRIGKVRIFAKRFEKTG